MGIVPDKKPNLGRRARTPCRGSVAARVPAEDRDKCLTICQWNQTKEPVRKFPTSFYQIESAVDTNPSSNRGAVPFIMECVVVCDKTTDGVLEGKKNGALHSKSLACPSSPPSRKDFYLRVSIKTLRASIIKFHPQSFPSPWLSTVAAQ